MAGTSSTTPGSNRPAFGAAEAAQLGRRTMLAVTAGVSAVIATTLVDGWKATYAAEPISDATLTGFVNLSSALTGVSRDKLKPRVDGPDLKTEYFRWLNKHAQPAFGQLLGLVPTGGSNEAILGAVEKATNDDIKFLARSIALLWLLGSWHPPAKLKNPGIDKDLPQVVSANAYTHGWVWYAAQTHPMGYSDMQFGYWEKQPFGKLEDYIGGP